MTCSHVITRFDSIKYSKRRYESLNAAGYGSRGRESCWKLFVISEMSSFWEFFLSLAVLEVVTFDSSNPAVEVTERMSNYIPLFMCMQLLIHVIISALVYPISVTKDGSSWRTKPLLFEMCSLDAVGHSGTMESWNCDVIWCHRIQRHNTTTAMLEHSHECLKKPLAHVQPSFVE